MQFSLCERVAHLPHDAQPVGGVAREDVGIDRQRRLELRQLQRLAQAEQLDAVTQHVQRAPLIELRRAGESSSVSLARAPWFFTSAPTPSAASPAPRRTHPRGTGPASGRTSPRRP